MKFKMGADVLVTHTRLTQSAGDQLANLVRQLAESASPLEGQFQGAARATFDNFKARADDIAVELDNALTAMLQGVDGMNTAFVQGEQEQIDATKSAESGSAFEAARFGSSGGSIAGPSRI